MNTFDANPFEQGLAAVNAGLLEQGIGHFRQAFVLHPRDAEIAASLGQALIWAGYRMEGLEKMGMAAQLLIKSAKKTRQINDVIALTEQLQTCSDFRQSLQLIQQAVRIKNTDARAFQLLAQAHLRLNNRSQAQVAANQAVKLAPTDATLTLLWAEINAKCGEHTKAAKQLQALLKNESILSPELASRAHREYAGILDKQGAYGEVFHHLHRSGSISQQLPDVAQQDEHFVPHLLENYQAQFNQALFDHGRQFTGMDQLAAPVFIIGFLRSGTTLVQEVLAAHSDVFVADENDFIAAMRVELNRISEIKSCVPEQLANSDQQTIQHLRQFYWQKVEACYGTTYKNQLFVDKTTLNLIDLGLIAFVFPEAKVLFVQRDPRDVCLSCFMQTMQPSSVTVHFCDWQKTQDVYVAMMRWWQHIHPFINNNCLQVRYEEAVLSFESIFKHVFSFLGLPWQNKVVDFHQSAVSRCVASPSYHQVSRPLYQSSVGRWQPYASEFSGASFHFHQIIQQLGYRAD